VQTPVVDLSAMVNTIEGLITGNLNTILGLAAIVIGAPLVVRLFKRVVR